MARRWQRGCLIFVTIGLLTTLGFCTLLPLGLRAGLISIPRGVPLWQAGPIWIGDPCDLISVASSEKCPHGLLVFRVRPYGEIWRTYVGPGN
jgi:hypothetical protein